VSPPETPKGGLLVEQRRVRVVPNGQHNGLDQFKVLVDGEYIGDVAQMVVSTVTAYSGKAYGYARTRKAWQWTANDGGGDTEFSSRKKAVDDLVGFVDSVNGQGAES
jgi:hypothetical protein